MGCLAILLALLLAPLVPFLKLPWLAWIPALLLARRAWRARDRAPWGLTLAALAWAGFALYEPGRPAVELQDAAELRLDLLIVAPLLWLSVLAAVVSDWRLRRERDRRP